MTSKPILWWARMDRVLRVATSVTTQSYAPAN